MSAVVIYDGDCGFCTQSVIFAKRYIHPKVQFFAYQAIDPAKYGLTIEQCQTSLQFVSDSGQITSANNAVAEMLKTAAFPWSFFGRVIQSPLIRNLAAITYLLIAKNRSRLPGSTANCKLD